MPEDNTIVIIAAVIVAAVVGLFAGYALASGGSGYVRPSSFNMEQPLEAASLFNSETISYTDNHGKRRVINIDRHVHE